MDLFSVSFSSCFISRSSHGRLLHLLQHWCWRVLRWLAPMTRFTWLAGLQAAATGEMLTIPIALLRPAD